MPPRRSIRTLAVPRQFTAAVGAFLVSVALVSGGAPGPLHRVISGGSLLFVPVFAGLWLLGSVALERTSRRHWVWAVPAAAALAVARVTATSLVGAGPGPSVLVEYPAVVLWTVVQLAGTGWAAACLFALALAALDGRDSAEVPTRSPSKLQSAAATGAVAPAAAIAAIIVVARLPYLIVWWPGIIPFDAVRALSTARDGDWTTYDPLGHTLLIAGVDRFAGVIGLGDAAMVTMGAVLQLILSTAAWVLLLVRMASWGVDRRLWTASLLWVALVPSMSLTSISLVKDGPFAAVFVLLLVALVEIVRSPEGEPAPRWAWITFTVAAALLIVTRNNGVHVVVLALPLLLLLRPRPWRQVAVATASVATVVAAYLVVLPAALDARPGPPAESFSLPIQQLGRIAASEGDALSERQARAIADVFDGKSVRWVGRRYVPTISDPIKSQVNDAGEDFSTGEFLRNWFVVARDHPATVRDATLAATIGYWAPGVPSHDGPLLRSSNDVRDLVLDIPPVLEEGSVREWVRDQGILRDRLERVPVLGLVNSPAIIVWAWILAGLVVLRSGRRPLLLPFGVAGLLLLTILAGPVSGGLRYSLPLYAALPLALAVVDLATKHVRRHEDRRDHA